MSKMSINIETLDGYISDWDALDADEWYTLIQLNRRYFKSSIMRLLNVMVF